MPVTLKPPLERVRSVIDEGLRKNYPGLSEEVRRGVSLGAIVFSIFEWSRPEEEFIRILGSYRDLYDRTLATKAIDTLKRIQLIELKNINGGLILCAKPDINTKLSELCNDPTFEYELAALRDSEGREINVWKMSDSKVYEDYLESFRIAKKEICILLIFRTFSRDAVDTIRLAAQNGVRFRILMSSPSLARKLRVQIASWAPEAKSVEQLTRERNNQTIESFVEYHNVEVREMFNPDDISLTTNMIIDKNRLRLVVYNPRTERTMDGKIIVIKANDGDNITEIFYKNFERAWKHSKPVNFASKAIWYTQEGKLPLTLFGVCAALIIAIAVRNQYGSESNW